MIIFKDAAEAVAAGWTMGLKGDRASRKVGTEFEYAIVRGALEAQLATALETLLFAGRDGAVFPRDFAHVQAVAALKAFRGEP